MERFYAPRLAHAHACIRTPTHTRVSATHACICAYLRAAQAALPAQWELGGVSFVNSSAGLAASSVSSLPLLGLFADGDLPWKIDRLPQIVPSLRQMASRAIELLQASSVSRVRH